MEKIKSGFVILFVAFICCCGYLSVAQTTTNKTKIRNNDKEDQVDKLFDPWSEEYHPGASIAIMKNGKIIYKKGYGKANLEYDIPNTTKTVFHVASISKQFTIFSILLLDKKGKLSLDDDVRKYIPEIPDFGKVITLRHLATHTSGLREPIYLLGMKGWSLDDPISQEQIMQVICKQKELNFKPGTNFSYCNTGYILLGEVVARVSGQPFATFVKQRIFEPLKMINTRVNDDDKIIVKNKANSYFANGNNGYKNMTVTYQNVTGSTGIMTTVEDLSRWALMLDSLNSDSHPIFRMNKNEKLDDGKTIPYGLGQFIGTYKGINIIEHGGSVAGYRGHLLRCPDQKFSVIVLGNDAALDAEAITHSIADIYLIDVLKKDAGSISPETLAISDSLTNDLLKKYEGKFELQPGFIMDFIREGKSLAVIATGQGKVSLQTISPSVFKIERISATVAFINENDSTVNKFTFTMNGKVLEGKRIKKLNRSVEQLAEYTGRCTSEELETTYTILIENNRLIARHDRANDTELTEISTDTFSGDQWFLGEIRFVRRDERIINALHVSTDRAKNVRFVKNE